MVSRNHTRNIYPLFFIGIICIGIVLGFEMVASFIFVLTKNPTFSKLALQQRISTVATSTFSLQTVDDRVFEYVSGYIPHPYVGFIHNPASPGINTYGWSGPSPITTREPGRVTIAIFGGSVATRVVDHYGQQLIEALQQAPQFVNKRIELINVALGGYKQPQQLLALEYLLVQGAQYDVVLNIDGYNEVTLPLSDNYWQHVAPIFPRSWNWYSQTLLNRTMLSHVTRLYEYQDKRLVVARVFSLFPFKQSTTALLLWNIVDTYITNQQYQETEILKKVARDEADHYAQSSGPVDASMRVDAILPYSVGIWKQASEHMAIISKENDMAYVHILQPNQYYKGSKILSDEEKIHAFLNYTVPDTDQGLEFSYRLAATKGYPLLVSAGKELVQEGVPFFDFTQLFSSETETIYIDDCCHYNEKGNLLFIRAIADAIIHTYFTY